MPTEDFILQRKCVSNASLRGFSLCVVFAVVKGDSLMLSRQLEWEVYSRTGDLIIGGVFPVHRPHNGGNFCNDTLLDTGQMQFVEAVVFGIEEINRRNEILPNISLGFAILDDCRSDSVALARALAFLPRTVDEGSEDCAENQESQDFGGNRTDLPDAQRHRETHRTPVVPHFDVVAVLGAVRSLSVTELLGLFQV